VTQLELLDPRSCGTATAEMLADRGLRSAIRTMRTAAAGDNQSDGTGWPYVVRLVDVDGRPAWAVDDAGVRYVVVGAIIFTADDIRILGQAIREAAQAAFERVDESYRPAA